ncbi:MAG: 30S ribosomal protein S20 [Phycisphaerales bacterium]
MPNTISAKKRVRQNAVRRSRNRWRDRRIKDQTKTFLDAISRRDVEAAETEFRKTVAVLDRIVCTGTIHRNTAARRKSRLAKRLNALKQSSR